MVRLPKKDQHPESYLLVIGSNIKRLRLKRSLSQQALAEAVGVSHPRISEIERGKGNPTVRTLQAIADELGVGIDKIFSKPQKN